MEFYNIQNDPGERNDLFINTGNIYSEFIDEFNADMHKWRRLVESSAQPDRPMRELDENKCEKHIEELRALGYLQ